MCEGVKKDGFETFLKFWTFWFYWKFTSNVEKSRALHFCTPAYTSSVPLSSPGCDFPVLIFIFTGTMLSTRQGTVSGCSKAILLGLSFRSFGGLDHSTSWVKGMRGLAFPRPGGCERSSAGLLYCSPPGAVPCTARRRCCTICKFKAYNEMICSTYVLWNDSHNKAFTSPSPPVITIFW